MSGYVLEYVCIKTIDGCKGRETYSIVQGVVYGSLVKVGGSSIASITRIDGKGIYIYPKPNGVLLSNSIHLPGSEARCGRVTFITWDSY